MKLIPVEDKIVLKMSKVEEKTQSGIILTGAAKDETTIGEVIAVGPGGLVDGKEVKMSVEVGQKVVINQFGATNVKVGGQEYTVVRMAAVLAVIED